MTSEEELARAYSALRHVVCVLEPLGSDCPETNCLGCQYERHEALTVAMNVLSGLPALAHYGNAYDKQGNLVATAEVSEEELDAAWTARGFEKEVTDDGKEIWHRGSAF